MHNGTRKYAILATLAISLGGCASGDPAVTDGPPPDKPGNTTASTAREASAEVAEPEQAVADKYSPTSGDLAASGLKPVDYAGLLKSIESHAGRPLVLDVWSTSCEPCVRELPNLVKLQEDYRDRGVVCATLNIDYTGAMDTTPEDAKAAAREIVEALGLSAVAENLYSTTPDRELFKQKLFQENRLYAPPAIFVFDRTGNVAATFGEAEGETPIYERVRAAVDVVLESPQPAG